MIYSNVTRKPNKREFEWGTIFQIAVGEEGRGRKLLALTCSELTMINKGENPDYTIGLTRTGRPRIDKNQSDELFFLLSSQGGYTRRGNGTIQVLKSQKENFEVLARGNGADGDAGRIGYWDCVLFKVKDPKKNTIIRVRSSGRGYGTPSDLIVLNDGKLYSCTTETLHELCDTLDIDMPCKVYIGEAFYQLEDDEWEII